jgi:hypothetical protein
MHEPGFHFIPLFGNIVCLEYDSLAVPYAHKGLWALSVDAVYTVISKGYARTNSVKERLMRIAAFITNQF